MRWRILTFPLLLLAFAPHSFCADPISIKIREVGLGNVYFAHSGPTLVSFDVRNTTMQDIAVSLLVDEVNLLFDAGSVTTSITLPLALSPGEERTIHVPLQILQNENQRLVLYLEARDAKSRIVGRAARRIGPKTEGQVIGLICTTPELCRTIQQSILLTGSPDEQTHKSQALRMVQLSNPPSEGWAYLPANTVVLAAPVARFSDTQREALELFLRNGGTLVLIEDQIADGISSNAGTNPAASRVLLSDLNLMNRNAYFLELYRGRLPFGQSLKVGSGHLARIPSSTSKEFSTYFRPLGFTPSTPEEVIRQFRRVTSEWQAADESQSTWLMKRLGTSFRFPSFLEMLLWMIGYLLVAGLVNFIFLRRIGRPEWAWITIPATAFITSVLLYGASARNRPRNFNLDDMTVYRMDNLSSLAIADSKIRISAPRRSSVQPMIPADWVYLPPRRNSPIIFDVPFSAGLSGPQIGEFLLDRSWETRISLRKWSFTEIEFTGHHRFAGTVSRDSGGRMHNDTGISFQQAIVVDRGNIFLLGSFPSGSTIDLARMQRLDYSKESGRSVNRLPDYPGPPFQFHKPNTQEDGGAGAEERFQSNGQAKLEQMNKEWDDLAVQPFSLTELVRGWVRNGDDVFAETKAVFFGLSDQATLGPSLRGQSPDRKSASLTVVTFGAWP